MIVVADSQKLNVHSLLFSLALFHLFLTSHPIGEAAPITVTGADDEGATQLVWPPDISTSTTSLLGSNTLSLTNNLDTDEKFTPPGSTQLPVVNEIVTVDTENLLPSQSITTESSSPINIATNVMKLSNSDTGINGETQLAIDHKMSVSTGFLLYEVERDILGLSSDNISYILNFGPEVFAYSLADKLGYLQKFNGRGNGGDDPHVPVIEKNRERLMEKLRSQATRMKQDVVNHVETEEPTLQEPFAIMTTDPISAHKGAAMKNDSVFKVGADSEVVTPKVTTESKAAAYDVDVITAAHDLRVISTEAPHNENPHSLNIIGQGGNGDSSIHAVHGVDTNNPSAKENLKLPADIDAESVNLFKHMLNDDQFLDTLSNENKELYLKLNKAGLNKQTVSNLLDWYMVWVDDQQLQVEDQYNGGYYGDSDLATNVGNGIGAAEGQEVRPEVELEGGKANDGGEEKHVEGDKNVNDIHSGGKQENIGMVCSIECVCVCTCVYEQYRYCTLLLIAPTLSRLGYFRR